MTDEPGTLICEPSSTPCSIRGSVLRTADCGHEVWVSPASKPMIKSGKVNSLMCVPCFFESSPDLRDIQPLSVAQRVEIVKSQIDHGG